MFNYKYEFIAGLIFCADNHFSLNKNFAGNTCMKT